MTVKIKHNKAHVLYKALAYDHWVTSNATTHHQKQDQLFVPVYVSHCIRISKARFSVNIERLCHSNGARH